MRDKNSPGIQAADVFGNFAIAYLFVKLGSRSAKRAAKSELLTEVFGGILGSDDGVIPRFRLVHKNDIECPDGECGLFIG